jgi:hypothetical protein
MGTMLARLRLLAPGWRRDELAGKGVRLREPDRNGYRHWIRVPEPEALLTATGLTFVGFFEQTRRTIDHSPIDELEAMIVDALETIAGVLCYYDLALPGGGYGNLILCAAPTAPANVRQHDRHRLAVKLTPQHYHSVRLHDGPVPGAFAGTADLVVERTRYYDYDSEPAWLAVRRFT